MVEVAAVRMQVWFRRTLGRWEADDRLYELPAWLEERYEAVQMLEDAGCALAGWPLDPAEQDPLALLRALVVAGGLAVAVNGMVHTQAVVRGWIVRRVLAAYLAVVENGIVHIQAVYVMFTAYQETGCLPAAYLFTAYLRGRVAEH